MEVKSLNQWLFDQVIYCFEFDPIVTRHGNRIESLNIFIVDVRMKHGYISRFTTEKTLCFCVHEAKGKLFVINIPVFVMYDLIHTS